MSYKLEVMDIVILAAGRGSRMCSTTPKVLHKLGNAPIVEHVLRLASELHYHHTVIVTSAAVHDSITVLARKHNLHFSVVPQGGVAGTGGAVSSALQALKARPEGVILILYGDTPLLDKATICHVLDKLSNGAEIVFVAFKSSDNQYGKMVLDSTGSVLNITYRCDTNDLAVSGVVAGYRQVISELLSGLSFRGGELYLTDIVQSAAEKNIKVGYVVADECKAMGINTRADLAAAEACFQRIKRDNFLQSGVTLTSPDQVFFSIDTQITKDVVVHPYVVFGKGVTVESGAEILSYSHLESCHIKQGATIGPFARIRGNSTIDGGCVVGNFVEIKESSLGKMSKVKHLSYLGNSTIGKNTNVGAGTVICNYDGRDKQHSDIGDHCFVGANSTIVSPVSVGESAVIAAGSVITEDLPPQSLGIARSRQTTKLGYKTKE
ncbi:bifunctional UDP-N-acetylglucosamine diphosphorylase/glucosamine-1-phosphate N-acetyltransferase GlmU [Anaplasma ovis]|nr:bifunctional UDP-N-acetylglucosamine diphosphorylase/glucosamine-1-phosphate N-acetyltransferase GlmU [Anaplasma ovis]